MNEEKIDHLNVEESDDTISENVEVVEPIVQLSEVEVLNEKIKELTKQVADAKNDYFKAYADAENRKKRLQQDYETNMKYRIQSFALDILPAIDNFERALDVNVDDEAIKTYVTGFKMIHDQFINALNKEGVEVIETEGKPFDPNFHHAIMVEKVENMDKDMVICELQKGYKLKDRVIRPSYVKVSE